MTNADFTTTLVVNQTPEEVFQAITNVRGWWSEEVVGNTAELNGEFTYHYKDVHVARFRLVEVVPNKKMVWLVLRNYFNFTQDQAEWKNTKVIFEISEKDDKTQVYFTHQGLVPQQECYKICHDAWTNYIQNSLRSLITIGQGQPNAKEGGFNQELLEKHLASQN
ncbi:SRPBCC family protein [Adhaeribacter radiodurans]|uniref:SRPBCC domain-containing protein n=1 Tax=Adhaeribacter radiodurans TaxID=2745197 RepID=A0A7L7L269_9BACT|nr:SRPBCC domain-containing protein [Adhaeribacter radiodurans]QMU26675.1 SRPBCC domain-containing protein [Adhaeribacter radiodurans]